jgi:thioredoxin reductase/ferredoxin-like protein FixX
MKIAQLLICVALFALLIWFNRVYGGDDGSTYGGLTWAGWASMFIVLGVVGLVVMLGDVARSVRFFKRSETDEAGLKAVRELNAAELTELELEKYSGPEYPHPVIFPNRCIGCQACVDACPHDVLAIVDGTAKSVAPDQCMEDTSCQAECPVNPKACIVINTTREVRSRPTPERDGASFETNVKGCYIIGDVSGVPLIKNAVKEGAEVIGQIAKELETAPPEPGADYDVAIIGIGPGGASAAVCAHDQGLRYIAIEKEKALSTIVGYPEGKYIFFKPDTKDWFGGLGMVGLGLTKAKYGVAETGEDHEAFEQALGDDLKSEAAAQAVLLHDELIGKIPLALREETAPLLLEKANKEFKARLCIFLRSRGGSGDWKGLYEEHFLPEKENISSGIRGAVSAQLRARIAGDQREKILGIWENTLLERGVKVNEQESCKSVERADEGDYFVVNTERVSGEMKQAYKARRVVIAVGQVGAARKLGLKNETLTFTLEGVEQKKVLYSLAKPGEFIGRKIVIVGGGNVAVEGAVDLVAVRDGSEIRPRDAADMNQVTLLVRSCFAPTVKFGNKFQLYQCADEGILDLRFGVAIKEMREHELVLEDVESGKVIETIPNDFVFAMVGGERPDNFLKNIGITIK